MSKLPGYTLHEPPDWLSLDQASTPRPGSSDQGQGGSCGIHILDCENKAALRKEEFQDR